MLHISISMVCCIYNASVSLQVVGNVVGIYAPCRYRERIRERIRTEFSAFTPSVGKDLYE